MRALMKVAIRNLKEALWYAQKTLKVRVRGRHYGSKGVLAYWVQLPNKQLAVLCYKRDWLHSFQYLFPQWGKAGYGQSINLDLLKEAANRFALILIVMPNGAIYECEARQWLYLARKYGSIRQPSTEEELEASIPSRELKRIK